MPCTYYLPGEEAEMRSRDLRVELDLATKLLCKLVRTVPKKYIAGTELKKWAESHCKMDAARKGRRPRSV